MKINLRFEGGLGDHLLANRFLPAIKESFPDSEIHMFSDTEGNPRSSDLLWELFDWYETTTVIPTRKDKNFKLKSAFCSEEIYPAHIDNIPDKFRDRMINDCDLFFDLHIDGLKWQRYNFPWQRYFFSFPQPKGYDNIVLEKPFILCHFFSRKDSPYIMDEWYVSKLVKEISKEYNLVLVADKNNPDSIYFNNKIAVENCKVVTPEMKEVFRLAGQCSAFIGIDSGIRYVPYHFCKPTFVFSKYCSQFGQVAHSHLVRWLLFKDAVFPLYFPVDRAAKILTNSIINPLGGFFGTEDGVQSFVDRNL